MVRFVLLYGLLLAGLALLLTWLDFRYALRSIDSQIYILSLAVIFTTIGAWAGARLTGRPPSQPFRQNEKAMRYLGISAREARVLELLAEGHSNKEIARLLGEDPCRKLVCEARFDSADSGDPESALAANPLVSKGDRRRFTLSGDGREACFGIG